MGQKKIPGPDLAGLVAAADEARLENVVIGTFAAIAHGRIRATKDSNLLVPDGPASDAALLRLLDSIEARRFGAASPFAAADVEGADHIHADSALGSFHLSRGLPPPLDFDTVAAEVIDAELRGVPLRVASLRATVGFKRLFGRRQGAIDLEMLERVHGALPSNEIEGRNR
jgi:hypothetical protein